MTPFPDKASGDKPDTDNQNTTEREKRKAKLKEKFKVYGFVALLVLMCIGFIMFIFKPEEEKKSEGADGMNYSVPEASVEKTEGDKRKALEQAEMEDKQSGRIRNLQEFGETFGPPPDTRTDAMDFTESAPGAASYPSGAGDPIRQSQQTAMRLNEQLRTFYDEPAENTEVADLKRQVEELTELVRLGQQGGAPPQPVDEVALLEKSFEMASRYMPGQAAGSPPPVPVQPTAQAGVPSARSVAEARRADDNPVSSLSEFELTAGERNFGFMTAVGEEAVAVSNAIRACVDEDQTVTTGTQVRLRLLEPLSVGGYVIPANASLYAGTRIEGQRLSMVVTSIESEGNIIPVELTVHDTDGQPGLNVPGSMERTAAKEALASIGQGFGSSISFTQDARQQIAMDLARGAMNGGSQYLSAKMREVKVRLKAGYQVLLIAKK
jgi:conjugative transposon TraM protein